VFGEFGVQFIARADVVPGATVLTRQQNDLRKRRHDNGHSCSLRHQQHQKRGLRLMRQLRTLICPVSPTQVMRDHSLHGTVDAGLDLISRRRKGLSPASNPEMANIATVALIGATNDDEL